MSYKLWPKDAKEPMSKVAYTLMNLFVPALFLFMQLSAFQLFDNFYSKAVAEASFIWNAVGFVLSALLVYSVVKFIKDEDVKIGRITVKPSGGYCVLLLVLSLLSYAGWSTPYNI